MSASAATPLIALVGPPNSGKTTLYNWLTGSHFRTVNYPGSTVEYALGRTHSRYGGPEISLMDTPGIYSLSAKSPDEEVALRALTRTDLEQAPERVVVVVDATQLRRHLYLVRQVQDAGFDVVVALTMMDLLKEDQVSLDLDLLQTRLGCPVVPIQGRLGGGVQDLVTQMRRPILKKRQSPQLIPWEDSKRQKVLNEIDQIILDVRVGNTGTSQVLERTKSIDRVLLHPYGGIFLFAVIMFALFSSIFWLAQPLMDMVDTGFGTLADWISHWNEGSLISHFLANGLVASFGAVLVFVPQIFILFLGIGFLEDSGYLARAATLMDRPLSRIGMNGRAFVPILSAYACAVPAMMAARTLGSRKERWLTLFILPFMTCSARLPVYALLLSFVFLGEAAWKPGLVLAGIYLASLGIGALVAAVINRWVKASESTHFMMELPLYRWPQWRVVVRHALTRTNSYVRRAGPVIFILALIVWGATTFPHYKLENPGHRLEESYAGQLGQVIEPVFEPLGVDWKVGVSLISAFAAREVFVSSLAVLYNIADGEDDSIRHSLLKKMSEARRVTGEPLFTLATVSGLIVFFMVALQCLSTTAMALRETGSWTFALTQLILLNVLAYFLAASVVQILS